MRLVLAVVPVYLGHDHVLTLLHVLPLSLDDGVEEVEVLDVAAVRGQAVDEVLQDALGDLTAQLVVVTEDVLHGLGLQQLQTDEQRSKTDTETCRNIFSLQSLLCQPNKSSVPRG